MDKTYKRLSKSTGKKVKNNNMKMASKGATKIASKNTKSTEIKFVKALNAHGAVADSSKSGLFQPL